MGISTAEQVSSGYSHSCAVLTDGTVKCWGRNSDGQLGDGLTNDSSVPVTVVDISSAQHISVDNDANAGYSCAVLTGGTVSCWGKHSYGNSGYISVISSSVPITVAGISMAESIAAASARSCVVLTDDTVRCWGHGLGGALGNGVTATFGAPSSPVSVVGISTAKHTSAGVNHSCAVLTDGTVKCWGRNTTGQLGDDSTNDANVPTSVVGISTAKHASAGTSYSCAVLTDGTVKCWGDNFFGQLGDGSTNDSTVPVNVSGF